MKISYQKINISQHVMLFMAKNHKKFKGYKAVEKL